MLALLEETYARELARVLPAPLRSVQQIVEDLERDGIVASRSVGRTRVLEIDPRFHAAKQLRTLLRELAQGEPDLLAAAADRRSRPTNAGALR